jgi:HAD superfamily hydrolase (TIGR01490 family)
MKRPFAVFDIDGTLIRWQLYHAIADALASQGYIDAETYQTMRDARMAWKKRSSASFRDYEIKVIEIYETVLKKLSFKQLDEVVKVVFDEYKDQIYTYSRDLIAKLKKNDYLLFAISGSQVEIVKLIANYYGFDDFVGTIYERRRQGFSGRKTIGSRNKDKALQSLVDKHGAGYGGSLGIGDSHSDIGMLELVEQPIAFNPEKQLFDYAQSKGWKIVVERKNMVYELEKRRGRYELVKTNG